MEARGGGGSYEYPGTVYLLRRILKIYKNPVLKPLSKTFSRQVLNK